jgi:hypothetical protein
LGERDLSDSQAAALPALQIEIVTSLRRGGLRLDIIAAREMTAAVTGGRSLAGLGRRRWP